MRTVLSTLLIPVLLAGLETETVLAQGGSAALTLVGEGGTSKTFTMQELAALPQVDVAVPLEDNAKVVFRGPTIRSLMTLVGAPTGRALRGPAMLLGVLAEASDGYKVAYMLADVDEQFGARTAIVALTQDGRALPAGDGPLRVIIAGEEHHARWIRQVIRMRLVRVGT